MNRITKAFRSNSEGASIIEATIALAILGIIAVVFLSGLTMSLRAASISDERSVAQNLAQSQMEYIKDQGYDEINNPPQYNLDPNLIIPTGYTIYGYDEPHPGYFAQRLDTEGDGLDNDDGLQKIIVTVKHNDKEVTTLENYKAHR